MKTIEPVSIWDNGIDKNAVVLDAFASNVKLNENATFNYFLFSVNTDNELIECVRQGSVFMNSENYALWNTDDVAWDFIAAELNLVITGDYVKPEQPSEEVKLKTY